MATAVMGVLHTEKVALRSSPDTESKIRISYKEKLCAQKFVLGMV